MTERIPIRERLFPHWIWRLPPGEHRVALTFDDGPDPQSTPRLLSTLSHLGIKATMFMTGERCAAHSELVRECADAGHAVAVHGYTHQSFLGRLPGWQRDSIRRTEQAILDSGATCARLFRPPYGRFNPFTLSACREIGFAGVLWSQIAYDWIPQTPETIAESTVSGLADGNIIVLHDKAETIKTVLALLPRLKQDVAARGWTFAAIPQPSPHSNRDRR